MIIIDEHAEQELMAFIDAFKLNPEYATRCIHFQFENYAATAGLREVLLASAQRHVQEFNPKLFLCDSGDIILITDALPSKNANLLILDVVDHVKKPADQSWVAFDELTRLANALLNRIEPILKNQRKAEQAAQKLREQEQLARKRQAILSNSGSIKSEDIQHRRNHRQAPELMMIEDDAFSRRLVENEDGVDALMKCGENMYDIIFMDCQMPRMDGYITTHEIRSQEASGLKHMPVVAMTANAMVGDREKCLNAGMDDYLSKPLRAEHLRKILQHWFILDDAKAGITVEKPKAETTLTADESPVDLDQLRMFTDGDPEEEKALAELFLEQAQEMIMLLEQNMGADKNDVWKSAAHRFKGSSGNLGAMPLHQLCKRAEMHFEDEESKKNDMLAAIKAATKNVELFFHAAA